MSGFPRLTILISGSGTTLQNFIDRCADGRFPGSIVQVISNRPEAYGLERARQAGLPVAVVEKKLNPQTFSERVFTAVRSHESDLVLLAGWLQLLVIPPDYQHRVLNIHPSLLPAFGGRGMYGLRVHEAVLRAGVSESGCTVHLVDDAYDTGPPVLQRRVPVLPNDTPATLAARVFEAECEAYPEAVLQVWHALQTDALGIVANREEQLGTADKREQ